LKKPRKRVLTKLVRYLRADWLKVSVKPWSFSKWSILDRGSTVGDKKKFFYKGRFVNNNKLIGNYTWVTTKAGFAELLNIPRFKNLYSTGIDFQKTTVFEDDSTNKLKIKLSTQTTPSGSSGKNGHK
jgi:hypothetical protein